MRFLFLITIFCLGLHSTAMAQGRAPPTIIRDTEIEAILKTWSAPLMEAAGLSPDSVNIILIQDSRLNAFVAGGANIFIYTGLIDRAENPGEIIGVIAHELGHIRGGHLVRTRGVFKDAAYERLLGAILGIGAGIATGEGGVAAAVAAGTAATAQNRFFAFSRVQESSADQAALTYLEDAGLSPDGLVSFMQKLESQELLPASQQDEYVRTHPLTRNRIDSLKAGQDRSPHSGKPWPAAWNDQHARMKAKLKGFITPERVAWDYKKGDVSVAARYARAIAAYRQDHVEEALTLMDGLLAEEMDNPFFLELKAQMLRDFGRLEEAVPLYRQALNIYPKSGLIRSDFGHALLETAGSDPVLLEETVQNLHRALQDEPRSTRIHRLLATAYGRMGKEALTKLHLAEEALLMRRLPVAKKQAKTALEGLSPGSSAALRAQDILDAVERGA